MAEWRKLVYGVILGVVPAGLAAQNTTRAILHGTEGILLNRNPAPATSAILPNDLIETQDGKVAKLDAEGTSVLIQPGTVVQFQVDELDLDHGFLQLTTSRQMRVRVNCITVMPVTAEQTQYDVIDVDGKVKVIAYKSDVKIHAKESTLHRAKRNESSDAIVHEGQQKTRDEGCVVAARPPEWVAARGGFLNDPKAIIGGAALIGALCTLLCGGDDPISPSKPQ